jgi:hypothetical protein
MEGIDARNEVPLSEADERAGYHRTLVIDVEGDSESVDEMQMESKLDRNENASNGDLSNTTADSVESTQDLGDNDAVRIWKASALPRTHMSDFLENAVREMLNSNGYASIANTITIRLCSKGFPVGVMPSESSTCVSTAVSVEPSMAVEWWEILYRLNRS